MLLKKRVIKKGLILAVTVFISHVYCSNVVILTNLWHIINKLRNSTHIHTHTHTHTHTHLTCNFKFTRALCPSLCYCKSYVSFKMRVPTLCSKRSVLHSLKRAIDRHSLSEYRGAGKPLARPGRKKATATEDFDIHISNL